MTGKKSTLSLLLGACLFASGAGALALEVAWSRSLSLSLGNSHQAVATVVASMMAGLCLGSILASRSLARLRHLPRAYASVEVAVGIYSALTPLLFRAVPGIFAPLYSLPPTAFTSLRFLLVFLILLPAAGGMGATLPIVTAALSRETMGPSGNSDSGSIGGRLYGLNTLGAFFGTLLGGFVLLPRIGLRGTILTGAATSLAVGILVWMKTAKTPAPAPETRKARTDGTPGGVAWILPLYASSGCIAMIYEITWTRVIAPLAGTSVYSFTLILAAILAGIGLGSLLLTTTGMGRLDPGWGFALGQILLAAAAFLSAWGLQAFPDLIFKVATRTASRPGAFFFLEFLLFGVIVLLPGLVLGALFPLAARLLGRLEKEAGAEVGRIYAWNTAGSIAGALVAGFVLVETLGSERTLVLASAASALLGVAALPLASGRRLRPVAGIAGVFLAASFPFLVPSWDLYRMTGGISQVLRDVRSQGTEISAVTAIGIARTPDTRIAFHGEGKTSTVTVVQEWLDRWLRVDGKTDASTTDGDMLTQVVLGQLPFFFAHPARDACVIGFGSGVTSHAVLTHPVRRLDNIEIEAKVIEASRLFEAVNFRPLADPRSRLIIEDARTALLYRPRSYDVIISEPSNPWMAGVNNLFTSEFYHLVRRRLNRGGIFCQWVQSYELSPASLEAMLDTLAAAFAHTHLFSTNRGADLILLASDQPLTLAPGARDRFVERSSVAPDLARVGIRSLADVAILYEAPVARPKAGTLLNTDDNSLIQYRAPLDMFLGHPARRPRSPFPGPELRELFYPGRPEEEALAELGQAALRREDLSKAENLVALLDRGGHPGEAADLEAGADALRQRIQVRKQVDGLLQRAEDSYKSRDLSALVAALQQAEALGLDGAEQQSRSGFLWLNIGRDGQAEERLNEVVSGSPNPYLYQSLAGRGAARMHLGRREEGLADLAAAKSLDPDQPLAYLLLGLALNRAGDKTAAVRELQTGLRKTPTDDRFRKALSFVGAVQR